MKVQRSLYLLLALTYIFAIADDEELEYGGTPKHIVALDEQRRNLTFRSIPAADGDGLRIKGLKKTAEQIESFNLYANNFYGPIRGRIVVNELNLLGRNFEQLCVDPGIVNNLHTFALFVLNNRSLKNDPWKARQAFSDSLGSVRVYRAIAVPNETQAADLKAQGSVSEEVRSPRQPKQHFKYIFNEGKSNKIENSIPGGSMNEFFVEQIQGNESVNIGYAQRLISTSYYPELSTAVAYGFKKQKSDKIALLTLSIPKLDLIYPNHRFGLLTNYPDLLVMRLRSKQLIYSPSRELVISDGSDKIESFVYYAIEPSEISDVQFVDDKDIGYVITQTQIRRQQTACFGRCPIDAVHNSDLKSQCKYLLRFEN